jgi:hypothetical protein
MKEVVGHLVAGQRGRAIEVDARREGVDSALGDGDVLGVAAAAVDQLPRRHVDRLSNARRLNLGARLHDHPAHLDAGDGGQRRHPGIDAAPHEHLRHVHADGVRLHEHVATPRHRRGNVHVLEDLGPAGALDSNGFHDGAILSRRVRGAARPVARAGWCMVARDAALGRAVAEEERHPR